MTRNSCTRARATQLARAQQLLAQDDAGKQPLSCVLHMTRIVGRHASMCFPKPPEGPLTLLEMAALSSRAALDAGCCPMIRDSHSTG